MSPLSTLKNCDNSSILKRRSKRPTRVTRGSFSILNLGPDISLRCASSPRMAWAFTIMVRNLYILNTRPFKPARSCE